jgi:hypothetical protein
MRRLRYIGLFLFVLLLELYLSVLFTSRAVNLAKYPYRREERYAAHKAYYEGDRSAEKLAAYQQELRRAHRHLMWNWLWKAGAVFSVFLLVDGVLIYGCRCGRKTETVA